MQFTFYTIAAMAALFGSSTAHMRMTDPPQWAVPGESQGPLDPTGADFPCANGVANPTAARTYTAGGTGMLQVQGTAVHGGGSGQMLITYDFPPTASSKWRVMTTWEGDHPLKADGNLSPADPNLLHDPIPFTVPAGLPSGKAVVAWSWFNKIGNREMYMKCATVAIEGKASSASNLSEDPGMLALPTFFRANSGNGCTVPEGINAIAFKNPGQNVVRKGGYTGTPVGCDNSEPGSGTPVDETPAPTKTAEVPKPTSTDGSEVPYPTQSSGGGEESGGDDNKEPVAPTPTGAPTTPSPTPANPTAPEEPVSGTCPEGKVYCNPDGTWSRCGSGYKQLMGKVPAGMQCVNGEFSAARKRSIRFSPEHMRHRRH